MKRKSESEIQDELRAIYAGQDGAMPDLTKLERKGGSKLTRFLTRLVLGLLLVSAAAWGGFYVWTRGGIDPGRPLRTEIEAPESVRSGEEAFYTFRYENAGNAPLAALQLKLVLPAEFEVTSLRPDPTSELTWNEGSLARGSDGSVTVGGVFRSDVPSAQAIQALYTYRPANFSSDFQDIATARVSVDASVIAVAVNGPEEALPGDEVSYAIDVRNEGTREAADVLVTAEFPDGFLLDGSEPASSAPDAPAWTFDRLAPGELRSVTVRGRFTASEAGTRTLRARVAFLGEEGSEFSQASAEASTEVLGAAVAFGLVVNGSADDQAVDPGGTLRVSVDYANDGNETVRGLSFALSLTGDGGTLPVDWSRADLGGGTRSGATITWSPSAHPEFAAFSPSASGTIDLSLPILSTIPSGASGSLTLALAASMEQVGASAAGPRSIDASPVRVLVNSDFRASAHARYYAETGEPLGTGPLPPKADATTTYRVVWRVANSFHALSGLRMTTNLPPDVAWTGTSSSEAGAIRFDETTRMVTWSVDTLPTSVAGAEAAFDVAVTPDADDVGSFYKLTNAIAAEATDTVTKDQVSDAMDILTSELPEDAAAEGKGVVVK